LALGTTSTGDFLPVKAAQGAVPPMPPLIESYAEPGPIDRVNRFTLPGRAEVEIVEQGALYDRFTVSTPVEFVFRLYTFYFPGWRAYIDGAEVEIELGRPEGFITFWVPEGEHEVLVRFEDTPPRTVGWIISAAGLGVLILALMQMPAARMPAAQMPATQMPDTSVSRSRAFAFPSFLWLGGALLLFVVFKGAVLDPQDSWLRCKSPPGQARVVQHELRADFGGQIELLGYDLPRQRVRSGERFSVVLYWHALVPVEANYQSFVHLAASEDVRQVWAQEDHLNPGGLPTTRWPLDRYVWDEFEIVVPPETPPGRYVLNVGIYSMDEGYRLQRYDEDGRAVGDSIVVGSIEVQ
jgi:hypothetical protein